MDDAPFLFRFEPPLRWMATVRSPEVLSAAAISVRLKAGNVECIREEVEIGRLKKDAEVLVVSDPSAWYEAQTFAATCYRSSSEDIQISSAQVAILDGPLHTSRERTVAVIDVPVELHFTSVR
jgi:hypothetical protein